MSQENTGWGERIINWSERAFRALVWAITAYSLLVAAIGLYDWIRHPLAPSPYAAFGGHPAYRAFALFVGGPLLATIAILILRRQPGNLLGPLLLAWTASVVTFGISVDIEPALYYIVSLPINAWWTTFIMLPYLFPDGRAFPRSLTPYLLFVLTLSLVSGVASTLAGPSPDATFAPPNPFHVAGVGAVRQALSPISMTSLALLLPGIFLSPIFRYRRADFRQRQQIKAFTWCCAVLLLPYFIFYFAAGIIYGNNDNMPPLFRALLGAFIGLIGFVPPVAIGYSILRHRLFDIDVVIRRTLVYTIVTASLALVFFGLVIVLQRLFTGLTGQQSPVALVASTLVIAALFSPLRRRVQDAVDRRFYRRKYDAARVLADFGSVARNETNLDALTHALGRAVDETLQPATVGVWLQNAEQR